MSRDDGVLYYIDGKPFTKEDCYKCAEQLSKERDLMDADQPHNFYGRKRCRFCPVFEEPISYDHLSYESPKAKDLL